MRLFEIKIYNKSLNQLDVISDYQTKPKPDTNIYLQNYWPFDGNLDETVASQNLRTDNANIQIDIKKIEIIDFSLHERGPPEDRRFAKDAQLRFNIRRGNAFCKIEEEVFIIRRGMRKFYDIEPAFLKN